VYPLGRLGRNGWFGADARRVYREKLPFVVSSAIGVLLAAWARERAIAPLSGHGLEPRIAQAFYGVWFYVIKTLIPLGISACYPIPATLSLHESRFLLCLLEVLGVTVALIARRRRLAGVLAAWSSYLVIQVPSSGLFALTPCIAADRYGFLSTMSLFVVAACCLCRLAGRGRFDRRRARGLLVAGWLVVLVLIVLTRNQCRTWRGPETLWSHALAVSAGPNPVACYSLALFVARDPNRLPEAEALISRALSVTAIDFKAHNALGSVLARQRRFDEALPHLLEALRLNPDDSYARVNLGNVLALRGDHTGALAAYRTALKSDPDNPQAHSDFATFLLMRGRPDDAAAHFIEALRIDPTLLPARRALDELRQRQRRTDRP
jgi:tetratricopeptide (TPR) repeat protein